MVIVIQKSQQSYFKQQSNKMDNNNENKITFNETVSILKALAQTNIFYF